MVRDIVKGEEIFSRPSENATRSDAPVITDLSDTLRANSSKCVGMAANMIGVRKNIIAVAAGPVVFVMVNPVITEKKGEYVTQEGCLSLDGVRKCTRYREIEVEYLDYAFRKKKRRYTGFTAEIIQHEIDHLRGVII